MPRGGNELEDGRASPCGVHAWQQVAGNLGRWDDLHASIQPSGNETVDGIHCTALAQPATDTEKRGWSTVHSREPETRTDSFVYFVRLLTFEETASGSQYFKIGKATSIPSRIKQFGPCELVALEVHTDSRAALKREKELHKQFAAFRRPETEIFLLDPMEVLQVRIAMNRS